MGRVVDVTGGPGMDPEELRALFEGTVAVVHGYFERRVGRESPLPEDLTVGVFSQVKSSRQVVPDDDASVTRLLEIARSRLVQQWRSERGRGGGEAPRVWVGEPSDAARFVSSLGRLTSVQRTAFVLCHVDGLSVEETADLIGVSPRRIRSRLERARTALGRALGVSPDELLERAVEVRAIPVRLEPHVLERIWQRVVADSSDATSGDAPARRPVAPVVGLAAILVVAGLFMVSRGEGTRCSAVAAGNAVRSSIETRDPGLAVRSLVVWPMDGDHFGVSARLARREGGSAWGAGHATWACDGTLPELDLTEDPVSPIGASPGSECLLWGATDLGGVDGPVCRRPVPPTESPVAPMEVPFVAGATAIDPDGLLTAEQRAVIDPRPDDVLLLSMVGQRAFGVVVRLRAGAAPHIYSTACSVLLLVDLPAGWDGTCLEATVDGARRRGTFTYRQAEALVGSAASGA